ncbi:MAG: 2-hydroxyglutaryl-CoA dehydratase [Oscillospiraceae bacterium]|nr:2-hydroxyglutaryl-CoA dehydratase [Oscillospiraceae bacterium]
MLTLGIDIGSTTSKCVLLRDGEELLATSLVAAGIGTAGAERAVEEVLARAGITKDELTASAVTGYGRHSWQGADYESSELSCHAMGARYVFPEVRSIIDIGGQDAKVICLDAAGRMSSFLMNDKCAAGTGRFLDVMAGILQIPVSELGAEAAKSTVPAAISSTCTVFAESEVISQLSSGAKREDVVAGICRSVAVRTAGLAKRQALQAPLCMSGGVAANEAVRGYLAEELGMEILYSDQAQLFGALGAARLAWQKSR